MRSTGRGLSFLGGLRAKAALARGLVALSLWAVLARASPFGRWPGGDITHTPSRRGLDEEAGLKARDARDDAGDDAEDAEDALDVASADEGREPEAAWTVER